MPPNDEALSNKSIKGMLKAKSNNSETIINFCSCRFFIVVQGLGFKVLVKTSCYSSNSLRSLTNLKMSNNLKKR